MKCLRLIGKQGSCQFSYKNHLFYPFVIESLYSYLLCLSAALLCYTGFQNHSLIRSTSCSCCTCCFGLGFQPQILQDFGKGARGVATAALARHGTASAGHAAAPSTPRKRGKDPARATGASLAAAAAAAVGREGAKYRAHAYPTHTHTSPPKPFPPKPFPPGRRRHVRPPAPKRSPPGITLPQLQRQRNARRVIQEGGDGAQAELRASHGSAEQGTGGDRGSAQGHAQGAGRGTRGKEQGRSSGGGQSAGSGRHDSGQGAGKRSGHRRGAQGRGQGAKVH